MNRARGEAAICGLKLRPSFENLVAAEEELGPLFALVERAAEGKLKLSEMIALLWHCLAERGALDRTDFAERVAQGGLAAATPALKVLLGQVLRGVSA